ncbi:hypothetical protein PVW53_21375 [Seohaeicola sp. SP36]|uniref:hypothetical protein n=1 Tax=Seohaeicola sp. SP36 TaxID=3028380 RepID=UPI00237BF92E|nr:hypothetical protein [Seohaeicola sp. SP36]MDD9738057.1 hypothetical protein [Seohaeicola sp. SP36]
MFDSLPTEPRDHILDRARCFFFDHGHDLASAAAMLGGAAAEARVVSCAIHLEETGRIDRRTRRDLVALHRLLALHDVGDPDDLETALFSTLHPASAEVETICLLTDMLEDLLRAIDTADRLAGNHAGDASLAA